MRNQIISVAAFVLLVLLFAVAGVGQTQREDSVFRSVKLVVNDRGKFRQKPVDITFGPEKLSIVGKDGLSKVFVYEDIVKAEYSYTKSPRWKTGVGLSAAAFLIPPLWLVSIPISFTKHRRHWLTIRTAEDFAILKLSKGNRKHLIATFETRSGVDAEGLGEDK